jgi:hypothetical protein
LPPRGKLWLAPKETEICCKLLSRVAGHPMHVRLTTAPVTEEINIPQWLAAPAIVALQGGVVRLGRPRVGEDHIEPLVRFLKVSHRFRLFSYSTFAPCCFHGEAGPTGWVPAGSRRKVNNKPLPVFRGGEGS